MFYKGHHLSYCTNIHPGESWEKVKESLHTYIPKIKEAVSPDTSFGIGLRLSNQASKDILKENQLEEFKEWLSAQDCYVFTFNGFPYGDFHGQMVKDKVHQPDWTTNERLEYTLRLFNILADLVPKGMDGGISTSPLSYKYWHSGTESIRQAKQTAGRQLAKVAAQLYRMRENSGKLLHLDIEPEPDGLIENSGEFIDFFREWLTPEGTTYLQEELGLPEQEAEAALKEHIRLCYDVCHFAIVYEKPAEVFARMAREGIKVGKIQLSAALNAKWVEGETEEIAAAFAPFVESTYLHQVVEQDKNGQLNHFPDLPEALKTMGKAGAREWRTHFHVPVFLNSYGKLASTQEAIVQVLEYLRKEKVCTQLEVETYTWEVLPEPIRLELADSIIRELQWVKENM